MAPYSLAVTFPLPKVRHKPYKHNPVVTSKKPYQNRQNQTKQDSLFPPRSILCPQPDSKIRASHLLSPSHTPFSCTAIFTQCLTFICNHPNARPPCYLWMAPGDSTNCLPPAARPMHSCAPSQPWERERAHPAPFHLGKQGPFSLLTFLSFTNNWKSLSFSDERLL